MKQTYYFLFVFLFFCFTCVAKDSQHVGNFALYQNTTETPWQIKRLDPDIPATKYRIKEWDGIVALEARADASMALFIRPIDINLKATPILCWQWRAENTLNTADMALKRGDDFVARVYVGFARDSDSLTILGRAKRTLARSIYGKDVPDIALNYVWDNRYAIGFARPNVYTRSSHMLVLQSGNARLHQWVKERRNVLQDAVNVFGTSAIKATSLALAADTDNTGEQALSGFANLHFVAESESCL